MNFPLPHVVGHLVYNPTERDDRNDPIDAWDDPVDVPCFWHTGPTHEPQIAGHDRVRVDAAVYVSEDVAVSSRDRFTLPRWGTFDVEGEPEDYNHGPFGWAPGMIRVNLKKVAG